MNNSIAGSCVEVHSPNSPSMVAPDGLTPGLGWAGFRLRSLGRHLGRLVVVCALSVACYFAISRFFLQGVTVVGVSMRPTLDDSQRYLLNRWIYHVRAPQPNDLVVLRDPLDKGFSVKRIVAGAGDAVLIKDGSLYVNGHKLAEPYLPPGTPTFACGAAKDQLFQCGPGQYFVLGDNRKNSVDSRSYGPVRREDILGLIIH